MKLFDNIKSKIVQTATNIGNTIDRDKEREGVQLFSPTSRIARTAQSIKNDPGQLWIGRELQKQMQPIRQSVQSFAKTPLPENWQKPVENTYNLTNKLQDNTILGTPKAMGDQIAYAVRNPRETANIVANKVKSFPEFSKRFGESLAQPYVSKQYQAIEDLKMAQADLYTKKAIEFNKAGDKERADRYFNAARESLNTNVADERTNELEHSKKELIRTGVDIANVISALQNPAATAKTVAMGGLLSSGLNSILGDRDERSFVKGMESASDYAGLVNISNPIIAALSYKYGSLFQNPAVQKTVSKLIAGGGNVLEDRAISKLYNEKRTVMDDVMSFGVAFILQSGGTKEDMDYLKDQMKIRGLNDSEIKTTLNSLKKVKDTYKKVDDTIKRDWGQWKMTTEDGHTAVYNGRDFIEWKRYFDSQGTKYKYEYLGTQGGFADFSGNKPKVKTDDILNNRLASEGTFANTDQILKSVDSSKLTSNFNNSLENLLRNNTTENILRGNTIDNAIPEMAQANRLASDLSLDKTAKQELKQADLPTTNWLKKTYHNLQTQTPQRLKAVFGDEVYSKNLEPIMGDLDRASHDADNFIKNGLTVVGDKAKELGITNKSKDIDLIRHFEDGKKGYQKVVDEVGESRAKDLHELYRVMRSQYDEFYNTLAPLAESVGKKLPKRANFLSKQTSKSGLDLTKGGVTGETSASIFKKQKSGDVNPMDAYALYLNRSANLFLEPFAKEFEAVKKALARNPNSTPEMLKELQRVADEITGAGKEISSAQDFFNQYMNLTKQAAVLGKFSTTINQVLGIVPGVANAGVKNTIEGILDPEVRKAVKEQSALYSSVDKKIPKAFRDGNFFTKTKNFQGDVLAAWNSFAYKVPLMGFVKQAQQGGAKIDESVIKAADAEASRVLGDRRAWMTPAFYNTFMGKVLAPFTQEQTAQATSFLQNIGEKKAGKVLTYLIMTKIAGEAWEKVSGYNPYFDPAGAIEDSAEYFVGSDKKKQNKLKAFMRLVEEGLNLMPPVQSIVNQTYSIGESFDFLPDSSNVFANDKTWMSTGSLLNPFANITFNKTDDGVKVQPRSITGNTPIDFALNVGAKYIPGVEQFNRTTQAAKTLIDGYATTRGGSPTFLAPDNPFEALKAFTFGQSSTKNAQEFYNNDFAPYLTKNQRTAFEASPDKVDYLKSVQPSNEKINKVKNLTEVLDKKSGKEVEKILAGDKLFTKPTSQKEADANKAVFNELMAAGQSMHKDDINLVLFNGYTVKDKLIKNRKDTFKKLNTALENEYYGDQQKQDIIEASGATPEQYEYYRYAHLTNDEKLEELLPTLGDLSDPENFTKLALMRAKLAGEQGLTSGMITYLYEDGLISKTQQQLLDALEYDEQKQQFYLKKDSKFGSGGGSKASYNQALKLYKLSLPSLNSNKSAHYSFTPSSNLISSILSKRATRAKLKL